MKKQYLVPEFKAKEIEETKILESSVQTYGLDVEIDVSETGANS